jgi:pyruvate,water dikinase
VGALSPWVVALSETDLCRDDLVGGKAATLARMVRSGFRVPLGFCLTVAAYESFVREGDLERRIRMELGRKRLDDMRWEELWDAALRIRSAFLAQPLPDRVREALDGARAKLGRCGRLAVRSSALDEDSGDRSFAGLHESVTDVCGDDELDQAVRTVWASLWSDAALLYRRELQLDPARSRMAVLVQEMVYADRSGVAFGEDPRGRRSGCAIVEAVPGPCRLLVDGSVDPDRWEIDRITRRVQSWRPGERAETDGEPLLGREDLHGILDVVLELETLLRRPPDVEWTGRASSLTVLQARPITTAGPDPDPERARSLSLRPGDSRLRALGEVVARRLIPELEAEVRHLREEPLETVDGSELAAAIEQRAASLERWKRIYWDQFIPLAHGVRRLATYYNDHVRPLDPYEFVGLLRSQPLLAMERNDALRALAAKLAEHDALRRRLDAFLASPPAEFGSWRDELADLPGGETFLQGFDALRGSFFDVSHDQTRLRDAPESLLRHLLELSSCAPGPHGGPGPADAQALEARLWDAVGEERLGEARDILPLGRLSWKLRDDDNLLVAGLESQLLRAVEQGVERLRAAERLEGPTPPSVEDAAAVARALREPRGGGPLRIRGRRPPARPGADPAAGGVRPRQLVGQPASPGLASGTLRVVREADGLGRFRRGEVLACDAVAPTMTHVAMLAAAIVERRGGMLIHGAIIARELGIPCVNGVRNATSLLRDGDRVTVDGHLGIVTVGAPELDLELQPPDPPTNAAGGRASERLA